MKIFLSKSGFFITALLILVLFISCSPHSQSLKEQVEKFRLDNGLTVLLVKREGAPVFSGYVRIKVGSIEDPKGFSGMAHFFEHMAFKGTQTIGQDVQNEFVRIYQRNGGGNLNATTSTDFTEYFVSLPSDKLGLWAYMESERLKNPVFREFNKERDVVVEERRMRYDNNPDGRLYEHFMQEALAGTPYGKSVIGTPHEILSITEQEAQAFRRRAYIPSRMVVALVGNFDVKEARRLIESYFGDIPKGEEPGIPPAVTATDKNFPRFDSITGPDEPRFYTGYLRPAYPHPDDPVFDVLQVLLCDGRTSRLFSRLVKEKNIAAKVDCYSALPGSRLDSVFSFHAVPIGGHTNGEVKQAIEDELEKLKNGTVTSAELKKIKTKISADLIWALKSGMGMAAWLSYFESLTGDWRYLYEFQDQVQKMTADDLIRVARETFVPLRQVTVYLEKKS